MMSVNRTLIGRVFLALVCFCLLWAATVHHANHRSLHVMTDTSSLTFELNDKTYAIRDKSLDVSLKPGSYKYRAVAVVDSKRVVLTGTINLTAERSADLRLNFSIYHNQAFADSICKTLTGEDGECPVKFTVKSVRYAENYQWAVVSVQSPDIGEALTVLRVDNGSWEVISGPDTNIKTGGYFPQSVERIIEDEQ